ncbi:MAG: ABC transporter permease [Vicinamibacterales bacterium]
MPSALERLAVSLISFSSPVRDREWIIGDIEEEFARVAGIQGLAGARRWVWGEAFRVVLSSLRSLAVRLAERSQGDGLMQTLLQDLRYAIRLLLRSPAFAATAILILALSIGANAAIFSAVKGMLIAPLPYPAPERLVRIFEENPTTPHFPMAPADFRDYRLELRTFESIAAYLRNDLQLVEGDRPEQLRGMQVTAGFFRTVGIAPALGREFEPAEEIAANGDVVVLSHGLWMRRFQGDPAVIGRPVRLSGRVFRVVGVLPAGFQHVGGTYRTYGHGEVVDIWSVMPVPMGEEPQHRFSHYFNVVGRLRPGVSWTVMAEDLKETGKRVAQKYPEPPSPWVSRAAPLKDEIVGTAPSTLTALSWTARAVLLLACLNVAGLLLGRASRRTREIGVRAALGATRGRLALQLLIESLVLACAGGTAGVSIAYAAIAALARYGPADTPRLQAITVDSGVLLYTAAATMLSALLFGLIPAWQLARAGLGTALKEGGRTVAGLAHQRLRHVLAGAQVALAFVLVVAGGLLLRSFISVLHADAGFSPEGALTASLELPTARYDTPAKAADFFTRALERIRALPGVQSAAIGSDLPWTGYDENTGFSIAGRQFADGEEPEGRYHFVTAGYASATGIPVLAGREISESDTADAPMTVLLNGGAARKYWGSPEAAVGARIKIWGRERTVAGVIGDLRDLPWDAHVTPAVYFPVPQTWYSQRMFLVARTATAPDATVDSIRRVIADLDPELPLANVKQLEAVASAAFATRRLTLSLVTAFGVIALFLAVVGIYGLMAQTVGQRVQEFGVRQALGATRWDIVRLVLSQSVVLTVAGLGAGLVLSVLSTRLLTSLLYGVGRADPLTFGAVTALLLGTSAVASYLPARRATHVSPATALRSSN